MRRKQMHLAKIFSVIISVQEQIWDLFRKTFRLLFFNQTGVNTLIVIIFRSSHVIKQHHWWKSQPHSILRGRIVIKEITCFTITMMLFLMFLTARKSTSSIKQVIFKQVHLFLSQIWLSLKKTISAIMDIVSRFFLKPWREGCWNDFLPKPLSTCTVNGPVYYDVMQFSVNSVYNEWTLSNSLWFGLFIQLHGIGVKV